MKLLFVIFFIWSPQSKNMMHSVQVYVVVRASRHLSQLSSVQTTNTIDMGISAQSDFRFAQLY